jgi:hypothetical protein
MTEATKLPADLAGALALIGTLKLQRENDSIQLAYWVSAEHSAIARAEKAEVELRDATNGWRRHFVEASAERDHLLDEVERVGLIADEVTTAAQDVVDAWHESERPYVGERMDILGTILGNLKKVTP